MKLNIHKYGLKNNKVKVVIKMPEIETLEEVNRYLKLFLKCCRV